MKIVIDISEHDWQWIANGFYIPKEINRSISEAITKGILLPKDHGDLIDRSTIAYWIANGLLNNSKVVIPADKEDTE